MATKPDPRGSATIILWAVAGAFVGLGIGFVVDLGSTWGLVGWLRHRNGISVSWMIAGAAIAAAMAFAGRTMHHD